MPQNAPGHSEEIAHRLKKTDQELRELQSSVKTGMINVKVLVEFRNAAERARQASAAVQQRLEAQGKGNDPYLLLPQVMSERVSMATELLKDVTHDLEGGDMDFETRGRTEAIRTVKILAIRLAPLFTNST